MAGLTDGNSTSDSGSAGDDLTNVVNPLITGTGLVGDTINLFDGVTPVGSATVGLSGNWSITTATLADGLNALTATQTDPYGNVSSAGRGTAGDRVWRMPPAHGR
jgi:hypothetical protein